MTVHRIETQEERRSKPFTRENLLAYFDQMSEKDGTFITTADWLADTAMLIVHEATKLSKGEVKMINSMTFGERLKLARERKGLKRHELGFSRSYIHYVENNQRSMLAQHIVKVCLVLGITPNWLLLGRDQL